MVNKDAIICLWEVERRVKCMLRFATRDLKKGYLCGAVVVETIVPTFCR